MSSTEAVRDFSDLYTDLLNRVRQATGEAALETIAKRYINTGLIDMHMGHGEHFPWAERRAYLTTHATYSTGTVSINQGDTTLTGVGTAWDSNNTFGQPNAQQYGKVKIAGSTIAYEVSTVATLAITLATRFLGADVSGGTYTYYEDEYALASDFLRPFDLRNFSDGYNVGLIDRREFRRRYPENNVPGRPKIGAIIQQEFGSNTTPVRKLVLHNPPSDTILIPYSYITSNLAVDNGGTLQEQLVDDDDEPIVPYRYRTGIVLKALHIWYRDRRDDARAALADQEYLGWISRMLGDNEIGTNRVQVRPMTRFYRNRAKHPYSSGRRFDVGGRFDRGEY